MFNISIFFIKNFLKKSEKTLSILTVLTMVASFMSPLAVYAKPYSTIDVTSINGQSLPIVGCLESPITFGGNGEIDPAGQISAYAVAVWDTNNMDPNDDPIAQGIPITLTNGFAPYTYTFLSGQIDFTEALNSVTLEVYHQNPNGEDAESSALEEVSVCITPPDTNDDPILDPISDKSVDELSLLTFIATATDADAGDTLVYSLIGTVPAGASITSGGVFTWTPTEIQGPGTYSFGVQVSDGNGGIDSQTISVTVNEVNIAPVASDISESTHMNTSLDITLVAVDSDLPSNSFSYSIVSFPNPLAGSLGSVSGNQVTFTPTTNYVGTASFTYKANDGIADSDPKTVSITVNNSAPVLDAIDNQIVTELVALSLTSINAVDTDNDILAYSLGAGAPSGASINPLTGDFTWTPSENQGPDTYSVTVIVTDGQATDSESFSVQVDEDNDAPSLQDGSEVTDEDVSVDVEMIALDLDYPVQSITFAVYTEPLYGILGSFFQSGSQTFVTYTPDHNYNGADFFKVTASDGVDTSDPATFNITINPVDDPACDDGLNNDGDELTDYPADPGCSSPTDTDENLPPVIALNGDAELSITVGGIFSDPVSADDDEDGDLTSEIEITGSVDTNTVGDYVLAYNVTDSDGADADEITRTVHVIAGDPEPECSDSLDNDGDDATDADDPSCWTDSDDSETYDSSLNDESKDITPPVSSFDNDRKRQIIETELVSLSLVGQSSDNTGPSGDVKSGVASAEMIVYSIPNILGENGLNSGAWESLNCSQLPEGAIQTELVSLTLTGVSGDLDREWSKDLAISRGVYCAVVNATDVAGNIEHTAIAGPFAYTYTPPLPPPPDPAPSPSPTPPPPSGGGGGGGGSNGPPGIITQFYTPPPSGGGGGILPQAPSLPQGQVLGASIKLPQDTELPQGCTAYINDYIKLGRNNNPTEVQKLQTFLNEYMSENLPITGFYGSLSFAAVKRFQVKEAAQILEPWVKQTGAVDLNGTGYVYKTTKRWINLIKCRDLDIPMPQLP